MKSEKARTQKRKCLIQGFGKQTYIKNSMAAGSGRLRQRGDEHFASEFKAVAKREKGTID